MFAFETASARRLGSPTIAIILDFDDPHLVHMAEFFPLQPNEWPQTHLRNCHSLLTNIVNNGGSSLCRGKDEHTWPLRY